MLLLSERWPKKNVINQKALKYCLVDLALTTILSSSFISFHLKTLAVKLQIVFLCYKIYFLSPLSCEPNLQKSNFLSRKKKKDKTKIFYQVKTKTPGPKDRTCFLSGNQDRHHHYKLGLLKTHRLRSFHLGFSSAN